MLDFDVVGEKFIESGKWKTHQYWGGLQRGDSMVMLSSFSPKVPQSIRDLVEKKKNEILSGSWDVFCGPVRDQKGKLVVGTGKCMSDPDMLNMNFFVEGVIGSIPGS